MLKQKLEQIEKDLIHVHRRLRRLTKDIETKTQRLEIARLEKRLAIDQEKIDDILVILAQNEAQLNSLPAPRIEIYEPLSQSSRGVRYTTDGKDSKKRLIAGRVWAPAGLASFKVNQKSELVESNGKFKLWIPLNPLGDTTVQMVAIDQRGRSTSIKHKITRSVENQPFDSKISGFESINFGRYHALIIGNSNYSKLPKLQTAVNDARKIAEILRSKYGFRIMLLLDANHYEIIQALDKLRTALSENDNLLIYYTGHGYLDVQKNRGYWQPIDAEPNSTSSWIPDYAITDILNIMAARKVLIIADSTYSGSLTRGVIPRLEPAQSADLRLQYIKELTKGRSRMVLTSGEMAPVPDAGDGDHSVSAKVLLDALDLIDEVIEGNLLHQEIIARVVYQPMRFDLTQVPLYAANLQAGHVSGDFIFIPAAYH
jgi:hypothetical protein